MTTVQYDQLFKNRAVVFDGKNLLDHHTFISYFDSGRLARIVGTVVYLSHPEVGAEPRELVEMDTILAMPKEVKPFLPYLNSPRLGAQMYALWRLEGILDGGSQHFADETLDKVKMLLRDTPSRVWRARKTSKCTTVRRGYWPTDDQMSKAGAPLWGKDH